MGMADSQTFRLWLQQIHTLRQIFGVTEPTRVDLQHWRAFLNVASNICKAEAVFAMGKALEHVGGVLAQSDEAKPHGQQLLNDSFVDVMLPRADEAGFAIRYPNPLQGENATLVVLRCPTANPIYLVLVFGQLDRSTLQEALVRGQMIADVIGDPPTSTTLITTNQQERVPPSQPDIAPQLELLTEVYRSSHFQTAAYALVNGIASNQGQVDQVVFGWRDGAYMRVRAMSHYERFERQTDTVKLFEAALEEAADQETAIAWDANIAASSSVGVITLAHRQLQAHLASASLFTFALNDAKGRPQCALMLVNYHQDIPKTVLEPVHFLLQTVLPRFEHLAFQDQPWPKKIRDWLMEFIQGLFGRDNLLVKSATLTAVFFLLASMLVTTTYRVDANGQFVTDQSRVITAPFDGLVSQVWASSGDEVRAGGALAELDTQDLMFQLAELQAELQRYSSEADKARASFNSVDLGIATARSEQVRARIERVRFMLSQSRMNAPLEGVVVEGDRRDLLAAPVSKGQVLFRVAATDGLYLSLLVPDADIRYLEAGQRGSFALISQPNVRIPIEVTVVVPQAVVEPGQGARFRVLATIEDSPQDWWRPGMTGVAKIEVGSRSWFWVWTHRLINRLRLALW